MQKSDDIGPENITEGNPGEKSKGGLESCRDERLNLCFLKNLGAELEDFGKLLAKLILQSGCFVCCHFF